MRCLLRINSNFYKSASLREYGEVQANLLATNFFGLLTSSVKFLIFVKGSVHRFNLDQVFSAVCRTVYFSIHSHLLD